MGLRDIGDLQEKIDIYAPELKEDEQVQNILKVLEVRPEDEDLWEVVELTILPVLMRRMRDPLDVDLPGELTFPTGLHLGTLLSTKKREVYLPPVWLKRNVLISGETGSGKTNLLKYLTQQLFGVPVWVFDFKNEYGDLEKRGFTVIRWQDLRLNPLNLFDPPDPTSNAKIFQRIFGHSQGLWDASQAFLGKNLFDLYKAYGSFDHSSFPSLHELYEYIQSIKVKSGLPQASYKDRLVNRLEDILTWEGAVFDCQLGFPIDDLSKMNIVFLFRGMKKTTTSLIIECLLASLYEYWVSRGVQNSLNNVVISDEAKHIFSAKKERRFEDDYPYIDELLAETRAFGIGLILADQEPSKLAASVTANSHIKLEMQLSSGKDIEHMSSSMGLSPSQERQTHRIALGQAIVKISGRVPFKVQIPLYKP